MDSRPDLDWISVTAEILSADKLTRWATRADCGAVVTFCGTARSSSGEHEDIESLEYETSAELAEKGLADVIAVARKQWPNLGAIAIHHRTGSVALTESAVVIAVSAPHRRDAFEAAQFCIDTLKESVPMWKREVWPGGSAWSAEAQSIHSIRMP